MVGKLEYIFSKKDKGKLFVLLAAIIFGSFLELLGVTIFMPFINIIMEQDTIRENRWLRFFYDILNFQSVTAFLAALAGVIIFIYLFKNVYLALEKMPYTSSPMMYKEDYLRASCRLICMSPILFI